MKLAEKYNMSTAQLLIRFSLQKVNFEWLSTRLTRVWMDHAA